MHNWGCFLCRNNPLQLLWKLNFLLLHFIYKTCTWWSQTVTLADRTQRHAVLLVWITSRLWITARMQRHKSKLRREAEEKLLAFWEQRWRCSMKETGWMRGKIKTSWDQQRRAQDRGRSFIKDGGSEGKRWREKGTGTNMGGQQWHIGRTARIGVHTDTQRSIFLLLVCSRLQFPSM